jgi:hypothetical protein
LIFYCKHGEPTRNSFISVARSILAQTLAGNPQLLPYFQEKASGSSDAVLSSMDVAKEMMKTALSSFEKTYIVLDGLDECKSNDRKEIAAWFQTVVEELTETDTNSTRCLFVSQEDGAALRHFRDVPKIKIEGENREDIKNFADEWHRSIEEKFGELTSRNYHVSDIISARAQGKPLSTKPAA